MRILVVSPGVLPVPPVMGGAVENMIARLHQGLRDHHEFHYISVTPPEKFRGRDVRFDGSCIHEIDSINPLVDFHPDNQFELQESGKWTAYAEYCCAVAKRIEPDIIHIHNEVGLATPLAQAVPRARLILHVNDEVVTRLRRSGLEQARQDIDLILSCSKYIASQIARNFSVHRVVPPRTEVFYNFVDTAEFDSGAVERSRARQMRERYGLDDEFVVGFVGRLIEQKGPQTLIRAVRKLRSKGIRPKLLFVGAPWYSRDETTSWVNYLKAEVAAFSSDVVFTGYVPHGDIPLFYSLADVIAVPSVWDDPSPFVAYEAQAMGLPVVASARGGIPEIVADWETGRCIDVFNTPLFAEVLVEWIQNRDQARAMGKSGRDRMVSEFSLVAACDKMRRIYESMRRT